MHEFYMRFPFLVSIQFVCRAENFRRQRLAKYLFVFLELINIVEKNTLNYKGTVIFA